MVLLERDEYLSLLTDGFEKTISGEGHCFFIMGEAGIGKSSLVRAFIEKIEGKSKTYIALCDSLFTPRPLGPLYDFALQMKNFDAAFISVAHSRSELFTSFAQELTQHNKPVVIIIEDIHWADEATLDFIKFFARRISRTNCLLVLTFRDNELTKQHPLRNVMGELPVESFTRIHLPSLSSDAVQELADKKGYNGEDVYVISGGNPFYVNEIIASYSEGVPENVKDAILSVYNRQDEATRNAWQLLSVMPEGLDFTWLSNIDESMQEAIDDSINKKILLVKNKRIAFKHELYRRTIEASLSPFKRIQLNKKILQLFLPFLEKEGAIERIVHYAKNAAENKLVVEYAPIAAKQAALVGAHIESAKLYLVAIEYNEDNSPDLLVKLYESYTYECYLTNQIREAIIYQGKALRIWKQKNEPEQIGNSLRFLSRLWWYDGHRQEAETYGLQAIEIFDSQPTSKAKAMAYSNLSQLKMLSDEVDESIKWGTLAIEMSKEINDEETLCHALNNVGTVKWKNLENDVEPRNLLESSLQIALKNSFHEHAGRAYTNLISGATARLDYDTASKYLKEGLQYCEERDLHSWIRYNLSWKARLLMETGNWKEAKHLAENLYNNETQPAIVKIVSMVVGGSIRIRKGEPGGIELLQKAKTLAYITMEHQRIIPLIIALLEYEWLTGEKLINEEEMNVAVALIQKIDNKFLNTEAAYWVRQARPTDKELHRLFDYYQTPEERDVIGQISKMQMERPYEKALNLFNGNEDEKRRALSLLQDLGADAIVQKLKQEMRSSGIRKIPRGKRESTKSNPAQLTTRELDILELLKTGAQNKEIAAKLFISAKTVDHHISSILFKLDVPSRNKAADEAIRMGIIK